MDAANYLAALPLKQSRPGTVEFPPTQDGKLPTGCPRPVDDWESVIRIAIFMLFAVATLFMAGWAASRTAATLGEGSAASPTPTHTTTTAPTDTATAIPTAAATRTPTAEPTATPRPPEPPVSEVAAANEQPPPAVVIRGGTQLSLPVGTEVLRGGCASDGECHWYNFYWAPTREVVVQLGEGQSKVQHELCHAHQHWAINGGAPLTPSDYDLESWYSSSEGVSFLAAAAGLSWPWTHSAVNGIEDFAWTCAYWYLDPGYLLNVSPERYDWAAQNLS